MRYKLVNRHHVACFLLLSMLPGYVFADKNPNRKPEKVVTELGFSYFSQEDVTRSSCLDLYANCVSTTTSENAGEDRTLHDFSTPMPLGRALKNLDYIPSGQLSYDHFDESAISRFARELENTEHSKVLIFQKVIASSDLEITSHCQNLLTALRRSAIDSFSESAAAFHTTCGDSFVGKVRTGRTLTLAIKVRMNNPMAYSDMGTAIFNNLATITDILQQVSSDSVAAGHTGQVELLVLQAGGTPDHLLSLTPPDSSRNGYHQTICPVDNVKLCLELAESVTQYSENDFSSQTAAGQQITLQRWLTEWQKLGIEYSRGELPDDILKARAELTEIYDEQTKNQRFVSEISSSFQASYMLRKTQDELNQIADLIQENLNLLLSSTGIPSCFSHPHDCRERTESLKENLHPINTSLLEEFSLAYTFRDDQDKEVFSLPLGSQRYKVITPGYQTLDDSTVTIEHSDDRLIIHCHNPPRSYTGKMHPEEGDNFQFRGYVHDNELGYAYPVLVQQIPNPVKVTIADQLCRKETINTEYLACEIVFKIDDNPAVCGGPIRGTIPINTQATFLLGNNASFSLKCSGNAGVPPSTISKSEL